MLGQYVWDRICLSLGPRLASARSWENPCALGAGALQRPCPRQAEPWQRSLGDWGRLLGEGPGSCSAQSTAGTEGLKTKRRFLPVIMVDQLVQSLLGIKYSVARSTSRALNRRPAVLPNDLKCPGISSVVLQLISNYGIGLWIMILLQGNIFTLLFSQNFTILCSEEPFQERNV